MVIPSLVCLWAIRGKLRDMLAGAQVRLLGKSVGRSMNQLAVRRHIHA